MFLKKVASSFEKLKNVYPCTYRNAKYPALLSLAQHRFSSHKKMKPSPFIFFLSPRPGRQSLCLVNSPSLNKHFSTFHIDDDDEYFPNPTESSSLTSIEKNQNDQTTKNLNDSELTPPQIVSLLNKHVIGQDEAKKAVAVALRNRWRRRKLEKKLQEEVKPMNILMMGPTGSGKTEIARRLAKLVEAPFIKVEMTKFTEVGIYGTDTSEIIKNLALNAFQLEKNKFHQLNKEKATDLALDFITKKLIDTHPKFNNMSKSEIKAQVKAQQLNDELIPSSDFRRSDRSNSTLSDFLSAVFSKSNSSSNSGSSVSLINRDPSESMKPSSDSSSAPFGIIIGDKLEPLSGSSKIKNEASGDLSGFVKVGEVINEIIEIELDKLTDEEEIRKNAVKSVEDNGIVVLDELDKLCNSVSFKGGGNKGEGVQKELLALLEGTSVRTKLGPIRTDHILFISAGAFHKSKPSDLMPELQGRLPIRVQLQPLTKDDFIKILTQTEFNLIQQQVALMKTEGVNVRFDDSSIEAIASLAASVNESVENIGARRLNTIMAHVISDISFHAAERKAEAISKGLDHHEEAIDEHYVRARVPHKQLNLEHYVL